MNFKSILRYLGHFWIFFIQGYTYPLYNCNLKNSITKLKIAKFGIFSLKYCFHCNITGCLGSQLLEYSPDVQSTNYVKLICCTSGGDSSSRIHRLHIQLKFEQKLIFMFNITVDIQPHWFGFIFHFSNFGCADQGERSTVSSLPTKWSDLQPYRPDV